MTIDELQSWIVVEMIKNKKNIKDGKAGFDKACRDQMLAYLEGKNVCYKQILEKINGEQNAKR